MNRDVVLAVGGAVVGVVLAWAASLVIQQQRLIEAQGPCQGGAADDHCIDVSVIVVNEQPQIAPIGDEQVKRTGNIWWSLKDSPGYSFSSTGIDFTAPGNIPGTSTPKPVAPASEFQGCGPMPNNQTVKCKDMHGNLGKYGYRVMVTGNGQNLELDPFIINN